jgi:lysophospholipase L1-like esterase
MKRRLLALAFGLLLGVAGLEVACRIVVASLDEQARAALVLPFERSPFRPHPYLVWEPVPGIVDRNGEQINARGYRGELRGTDKAEGVFRLLCLGGSTTFTQNVPEDATYPAQLEAMLRAANPGRAIEVLNLGVKGYTSKESLFNLALKGLDYEPDAIVVYHAVNDFYTRYFPGYRADYSHCRRVFVDADVRKPWTLDALEATATFPLLRSRLFGYGARGDLYSFVYRRDVTLFAVDAALERTDGSGFALDLSAMVEIAQGRGIHPILVTQTQGVTPGSPFDSRPIDDHNRITREIARRRDALLIDAAVAFPAKDHFHPGDPVHHTPLGARELARRVATGILAAGILERPAPRPGMRASDPAPDAPAGALALRLPAVVAGVDEVLDPTPYALFAPTPNAPDREVFGPHDAIGSRRSNSSGGAAGARGASGAEPVAGGPQRIVCLGGAGTYGLGVRATEAWPARLEARLGDGFEAVNLGVPGHTTAESLARLLHVGLPLAPSVVVIAHDLEDAQPRAAPGYRTDYAHARRPFRRDAPTGLERLVRVAPEQGEDRLGSGAPPLALRDSGPTGEALLAPPGTFAAYRNLRTAIDLVRGMVPRAKIVVALADDDAAVAGPAARAIFEFNQAARLAAAETGARLVEFDRGATAEERLAGGWLPSPAGHLRRAEALAAALR